jgi:anti-anti-sigma factor
MELSVAAPLRYLAVILVFDEHPAGSAELPVLRCTGDEDIATQGRRHRHLTRAARAARACNGLVVDLSELVFADVSFMVDLALLARRLRLRGADMWIRGAQPYIRRLIEVVGVDKLPSVSIEGPATATA